MALFGLEGFRASIPEGVKTIDGSIVIACRREFESVAKKNFRKSPYRKHLLLDPQLYLTHLDPARCKSRCAALATYDWFERGDLPEKRTDKSRTQTKWRDKSKRIIHKHWTGKLPTGKALEAAVRSVAQTQTQIGCEAVILAAPLTVNPNSDLALELDWLDRGLHAARRNSLFPSPVYATVALSDRVLSGINPFENAIVDTIIDQISAREIDGVYIVLELSNLSGYYLASGDAVGALLRLVDGFRRAGVKRIIVNYATVAALLAAAAGADTICTGWYRSERRLNLNELPDEDGGIAVPAYYSHSLASEINVGDDLMRVVRAGRLHDFADETEFSAGLLRALRDGKTPGNVPEWEHRKGNHTASRGHFYSAIGRELGAIVGCDEKQRFEYAQRWLNTAVKLADAMSSLSDPRNDPLNSRTEVTHQLGWQKAFEQFMKQRAS